MKSDTILADRLTERNYGIDLLRIVSMFMVCLLHVLGAGGILDAADRFSVLYEIAWFIEICAYCAVNCYALISGYVGINSKHKYSNILTLWLQVLILSLLSFFIKYTISGEFDTKDFLKLFFPVTFNRYWYFTSYFGLFLFMPMLDYFINIFSKNQLKVFLSIIVSVFVILSTANVDVFGLNGGYSLLWMMILYLVGGYIKKNGIFEKTKSYKLFFAVLVLITLTWISKLVIEIITFNILGENRYDGLLIKYTSPTVFAIAVLLLLLFSRIKFYRKPKIIAVVSSLTFGIYIFQMHNLFYTYISKNVSVYLSMNPILFLLTIFASALAVFIICAVVDYVRFIMFKLIGVKQLLQRVEEKIGKNIFKEKMMAFKNNEK